MPRRSRDRLRRLAFLTPSCGGREEKRVTRGNGLRREKQLDLDNPIREDSQGVHGGIESEIRPRRQAKSSSVMRSGDDFRKLLQIGLGQARPRGQREHLDASPSH